MPSKRQLEQRNAARAAFVEFLKKRRLEPSSPFTSVQLDTDNNKLNITDNVTSNGKAESGTWFWNESANKIEEDCSFFLLFFLYVLCLYITFWVMTDLSAATYNNQARLVAPYLLVFALSRPV